MLLLSRFKNEVITLETTDGLIEIMVVEFRNGGRRVRLGIEAPRHVAVHRKEVYETIQREKQA